jgi:hypothetical protein
VITNPCTSRGFVGIIIEGSRGLGTGATLKGFEAPRLIGSIVEATGVPGGWFEQRAAAGFAEVFEGDAHT